MNLNKKYIIKEVLVQINKNDYLKQIKESGWFAGKFLVESLDNGVFKKMCGEDARIFVLLDNEKVVSFCTYVHQDEICAPDIYPWIGFVYTFPEYRANHLMGILFNYIFDLAFKENHNQIYVSTNETGLYEKYGFEYLTNMLDITGNDSRIYVKRLK